MKISPQAIAKNFFKNSKGQIVIWQFPNIPLFNWMSFKLLSVLVQTDNLKHGFQNLSTAFLFIWAYMEIASGENYFRRVLGLVVMSFLIIGFFKI